MTDLKQRMYGFVPYNISDKQKGIQFGHAVVRYGLRNSSDEYFEWADNNETFIILNGGTTNNDINSEWFGTINQHVITLTDNNISYTTFNEPDLGNQLTAVVFLVDERVWNYKDYPNFDKWLVMENGGNIITNTLLNLPLKEEYEIKYKEWKEFVGGDKNVFLKEFLPKFRLA